ncbi:MAG TPA: efflux RND transporter periplasmic adaptor subunit [Terriglobales bacterium]|nr:efflux RND transporter periplasmic adaptor subunit [Terriglobales bacterium]
MDDDVTHEGPSRRRLRWWLAGAAAAAGLLALGAVGGMYWSATRVAATKAPAPMPAVSPPTAPKRAGDEESIEVSLAREALARAGIKVGAVRTETLRTALTMPGTVTSNAYRETKVNTLVGGVVRQVHAELGASVRRGDALAVVFSAELADAQMKYLSMQAMLTADHQKLQRTEKLLALGAVSRQELDEITAVHAAHETEVAAARQRLLVLGVSSEQVGRLREASHVVSDVTVRAPANGVVLARSVNPGQVVAMGQELFVVADLSSVWVIADVYEKDFGAVRVGSEASVFVPAAPDVPRSGRVAYVDPRVDPATRTAKARVEVPNPGDLKLGMFVNIAVAAAPRPALVVPRSAVQMIGERPVVYVALDEEGRFVERSVRLGATVGEAVAVTEGLSANDRVVVEGSFFVRAEAARVRGGG